MPDFRSPPVVEVALSVHFDKLPGLGSVQIASFWQQFRDRFPKTEEHPPLEPAFERFDVPPLRKRGAVRLELIEKPPTPRFWFLNQPGTELIQVQQDRIAHNWRKLATGAEYPRYERIRESFQSELNCFQEFIRNEGIGEFVPNQCDVTYVNHILWDELNHGEPDRLLTVFQRHFNDGFLPDPEDATIKMRFVIPDDQGKPAGRLHADLVPGYRNADGQPLFILTMTARGRPLGEGIEGAMAFLDRGREWVVRGFASLTTPEMHEKWGRQDGA